MHGKIQRAKLSGSWSQPSFKHWWKVWDGENVFDFYFPDDKPKVVVVGDRYYAVDPTQKTMIKDGDVQIYHVISQKEVA